MKFRMRQQMAFCGFVIALGVLAIAPTVNAAPVQDLLVKFGSNGSGPGQFRTANDVMASPTNGHIFVADAGNSRVVEFTPWGVFIKAFGWDVAPGAVNEQQEVIVKASAGQFTLGFGASTTGDLDHDAPASEVEGAGSVEAALNGLASISDGGGEVTVTKGPSDSSSARYVVSFSGGPLAGTNVEEITAADGTISLSGGTPSSSVSVITRADGTASGTGLESCTTESGCKAGSTGSGSGQLGGEGIAVAVDGNGAVYVRQTNGNQRIQKFDPAGRFVWMIGGGVDKTTGEDLCTKESGHQCGEGVPGTGPLEFSDGRGLALNPVGNLLVADNERIQEITPDGTFVSEIPLPGKTAGGLEVDPSDGELFGKFGNEVTKLSSSGTELCSFNLKDKGASPGIATAVPDEFAIDPAGGLYASVAQGISFVFPQMFYFDGTCPPQTPVEAPKLERNASLFLVATDVNIVGDLLVGITNGSTVNFIEVYGPAPVTFEPPPPVPPAIVSQFTLNADPENATVGVEINPHFWTDARYYVEYGTGECSAGQCESIQPVPPGALLTKKVMGDAVPASVLLESLQPATNYHYRFVAQSTGGGPIRGVGGQVGSDGLEGTFRTPALPRAETSCSNQGFRTGPSAALPDCRAYEMVSPVDKSNGDIRDRGNISGFSVGLRQSALDGGALTYSSFRSFGDSATGTYSAQYLARRGASGWLTEALAHPRLGQSVFQAAAATENEFRAFSADLCSAWYIDPSSLPYAAGAVEGFPNLYRRDNCSDGQEALTTAQPTDELPNLFFPKDLPEVQGFSADGSKAVFAVPFKMSDDAVEGRYQVYEASEGQMRLACILPNGTPLGGACSAGMRSQDIYRLRGGSLSHAISEDGSRVYWTASEEGPGKVYVRINGVETSKVSETETTGSAKFLGASVDGSQALFLPTEKAKAGKLYLYSLETEESEEIAGEVMGLVSSSDDLSHVYFVSKEALGGKGTAGQPNLYLYREGTNVFIATLSSRDVKTDQEGHYSVIATEPVYHLSDATPDGHSLTFISARSLTGYDNTDVQSGEPDFEVFQYAADADVLTCVSCNPSEARPRGRFVKVPFGVQVWSAALVPPGENELYTPRYQSEDGDRVFFNSYDALVARDTNGRADVYQWERAGTGGCTDASGAYSPLNAGCIHLISSGTNAADSELVDSSASGNDVFFTTDASLVAQDPGLIDIYDARVNGGFPPPPSAPAGCEGEACQGPSAPPDDPTPASSAFEGTGNVKAEPKARCGKGRASKKGRCVAKRKPKKKKHSQRSADKSKGGNAK